MKKFIESLEEVIEAFEHYQRLPFDKGESPIEEIFSWNFRKFASDAATIDSQKVFDTSRGEFRVDFVISHIEGKRHIGIECDGKNFDEPDRDRRRDLTLIESTPLNRIYRIRGRDLFGKTHDVLHLLSKREPWMFSSRSRSILERASVPEYLRNDDWGELESGFPFGIIRRYELDRSLVDEDYEDNEDIGSRWPTVIYWTQKKGDRPLASEEPDIYEPEEELEEDTWQN